jgi:hypothetical protein
MSERLISALDHVKKLPEITLGSIVDHVEGEALIILCLIAILPFMQPIPIPGLSSILGLIVLLQGVGLVFWSKPFLTERMKRVHITHERFEMIQKAAVKFSKFSSKISTFKHPFTTTRACHVWCGLSIILSAGFLSLPLPIPFSNLVPALSIFFICVGLLEEDILLILCGQMITLAVGWMSLFSFHLLKDQISTWF